MNIKEMINAYRDRVIQYSVDLDGEKALERMAIKRGEIESELDRHHFEIERLSDLLQLCIQVLDDLESLEPFSEKP